MLNEVREKLDSISNSANFDVVKRPIYYKSYNTDQEQIDEIPNRYALVRTDLEKVLSVVSNRYKLRKYSDLVTKVNHTICESTKISPKDITVKDWVNPTGTKYKRDVFFWNEGIPVKDNIKEKAIPHLRIYASYDSTWAEQIIFGSVYVLCMNGLVRPDWQFKVYNKHSANKETDYTVSMFESGLEAQKNLGTELYNYMKRKVTNAEVNWLFKNTLAKIQANSLAHVHSDNAMRELGDIWDNYNRSYGYTVFAVYQSATHWSSHPITKGNQQLVTRRREQKVIDMMNSNYWQTLIN